MTEENLYDLLDECFWLEEFSYKDNYKKPKTINSKKKIKKIKKVLGIEGNIEIIESSEINAYVDKDGNISVTSAALESLEIDELAFAIAHEESHDDNDHIQQKVAVIENMEIAVRKTFAGKKRAKDRLIDTLKIGLTGFATYVALSHAQEIEADLGAQKKLEQAGKWQKGGEKTFKRINHGPSLGHPSSELRRNILKNRKS